MQQNVVLFRNVEYRENYSRRSLIQEYSARPTFIFFGVFGLAILYLLANRISIVLPGIIGVLLIVVLGNFFGNVRARASYLEIGFADNYFFMKSAYDVAHGRNLKFYPRSYANPSHEGDSIYINYIDQVVRLRVDEWENWQMLWQKFNETEQPHIG